MKTTVVMIVIGILTVAVVPVLAQTDSLESAQKQMDIQNDWVSLGYEYLASRRLDDAEGAFKKAIRQGSIDRGRNGLGLVYSQRPNKQRSAIREFRRALRANPEFYEAQLNIARSHGRMGNLQTEASYRRAIEMNPDSPEAYVELSEWLVAHDEKSKAQNVLEDFRKGQPDHEEAAYSQALIYVQKGNFAAIAPLADKMISSNPSKWRWLAISAQALAAEGDFAAADRVFARYIDSLPQEERANFLDISLISTPYEMETLGGLSSTGERESWMAEFWVRRDPILGTTGATRRIEHYRRVWTARTFFSHDAFPWDRRGEVYIKFGEPDYRSRSGHVNELPSRDVGILKERIAQEMVGRSGSQDHRGEDFPSPESFQQTTTVSMSLGRWIDPIFPIDRIRGGSFFPWESWVYLNIGGGIEIVFTDRFMNGEWDYPATPSDPQLALASAPFHPTLLLEGIRNDYPDYFNPSSGGNTLGFHYDIATFQKSRDSTRIEVYVGIPMGNIRSEQESESTALSRSIVLVDSVGSVIARQNKDLLARRHTEDDDQILVDASELCAVPGNYQLSLVLADRTGKRWGTYRQSLVVPSYAESLQVSDLEVAWIATEQRQSPIFRKGDIWVIPMPTRSFLKDSDVHLYYEIYNLTRDEFGSSKYQVTYSVRQDIRKQVGLLGAVRTGFGKLFGRQEPVFSASFDQTGSGDVDQVYFNLETDSLEPGVHELTVSISDKISGEQTRKSAMFLIAERISKNKANMREQSLERLRRQRSNRGADQF